MFSTILIISSISLILLLLLLLLSETVYYQNLTRVFVILYQVRRSPKHGVGGVGMVQQQSLDSISFYTRPPQPKSTTDSQLEYSASRPVHYHQSQHQLRLSLKQVQQHQLQQQEYYPQQQQQLVSRPSGKSLRRQKPSSKGPESSIHDEGGFDEVRSFRTLPMVTKRATDYRWINLVWWTEYDNLTSTKLTCK